MLAHKPVVPAFLSDKAFLSKAAAPAWLPNDTAEMLEHIRLLHPESSDGCLVLAEKWHGRYAQALHRSRDDLTPELLIRAQFVSMNRFLRSRMGDALCTVGHAWLDFDPYGEDREGHPLPYRNVPLEELRILLAAAIAAAGVPAPSYWSKSGRGLHAVWVCEALPGKAAPKLQRILAELYGPNLNADGSVPARKRADPDRDAQEARLGPMWKLFYDAGLDRQTQDASRVLRIWGSFNQASGTLCERMSPIWIEDIQRCTVDALADAVLPLTNAAFRQRMAEKAERAPIEAQAEQAERPVRARSTNRNAGKIGVWKRKLADLMRIREHRRRIAVGQRHLWTFLTANAHAHVHGGLPATWAELLAPLAGLSVSEALDCLKSLGRRQKRREAGVTVEHGGRVWSPLFHYSGAKMADRLGVTEEEADAAGLNVVRPGKGKAVPAIERKAQKRIRDGAVPRTDRADAKLQAGRQGLAMRAGGKTAEEAIAAIRAASRRGRTWAIEAMKLAAASPVETPTDPIAEISTANPVSHRKSGFDVRFSGRSSIGGFLAPVHAPVSAPLPTLAPGEVRVRRYSPRFAEYRTATEHYTVLVVGEGRDLDEVREDLPLDAPDIVPEGGYCSPLTGGMDAGRDARFAAMQADLHREATRARRRAWRPSTGRSPARGAVPSLDPARDAEAYCLASGRSTAYRGGLVVGGGIR